MNKLLILLGLIILSLNYSCDKTEEIPAPSSTIYLNSFESLNDTIGWEGFCSVEFTNDAAPGGGDQSIAISCGCIAPHASFEIGPFDEDHDLTLSFWAKGYGMGGIISIGKHDSKLLALTIPQDSTWTFFQSQDTLFCPKGENLSISMSAGGLGYGEIIVDLLEVIKSD